MQIKGIPGSGKGVSVIWTIPPCLRTKRSVELAKWKQDTGTWIVDETVWNEVVMTYGIATTYKEMTDALGR